MLKIKVSASLIKSPPLKKATAIMINTKVEPPRKPRQEDSEESTSSETDELNDEPYVEQVNSKATATCDGSPPALAVDSLVNEETKIIKVGTRLSVRWKDGFNYGGVVTKLPSDPKRLCYVKYYDGDKRWHDLETEKYLLVYAVGTKVYKQFSGHGYYWGKVVMSKHDENGLYYKVKYSDGDREKITDEADSVQLLKELDAAVLAAKQKRNKRKRQDRKNMAAIDSRKCQKMA
jgi:hypothetical protein